MEYCIQKKRENLGSFLFLENKILISLQNNTVILMPNCLSGRHSQILRNLKLIYFIIYF